MTAQGQRETPDGEKVSTPTELQLAWLMERWGVGVLGPTPDFKAVVRATRAVAVYDAFKRDQKDRTPDDWRVITSTLRVVEGWEM